MLAAILLLAVTITCTAYLYQTTRVVLTLQKMTYNMWDELQFLQGKTQHLFEELQEVRGTMNYVERTHPELFPRTENE